MLIYVIKTLVQDLESIVNFVFYSWVGCKFFCFYDGTSFSHDLVVIFSSNFFH
jgi:hypothetical protein